MKTVGPHPLVIVTKEGDIPVEMWFELDAPTLLDAEAEIFVNNGRCRYSCPLFNRVVTGRAVGEVALLASLMRIGAESLRMDARFAGVELYHNIPGDISTDWSFYTFGRETREFVDPNTLTPPEA